MGKTPKGGLLRHGCDNLRPGPGTVVEHTIVSFLTNGPSAKSHNRIEPTTTLPRNFEPARTAPLMEEINTRGQVDQGD
uniref:Uncharacterized protein n=1 Tax=Oryza barthii TaxID=65489 RepID=A0A0D3GAN0_9ORYZ